MIACSETKYVIGNRYFISIYNFYMRQHQKNNINNTLKMVRGAAGTGGSNACVLYRYNIFYSIKIMKDGL